MKLQLPSVTLLIADSVNAKGAINVLEHCKNLCDFGAVKLLTDIEIDYEHKVTIPKLNSLVAYSIFMLTKCKDYFDTDHVLIVQRDGFILNPESWNPAWLEYDYIAPLFQQMDRVGSGGFSLRSKKVMERLAEITPEWDWSQGQADVIQKIMGYYEDGVISLSGQGFNIAPLHEGAKFAQGGNENLSYYVEKPFGFHRTSQYIDFNTGQVSSSYENFFQQYELEIK